MEIKKFKELGFTYTEIKQLIEMPKSEIVSQGIKLLEKHQQVSTDLTDKTQRLEILCYEQPKTLEFELIEIFHR